MCLLQRLEVQRLQPYTLQADFYLLTLRYTAGEVRSEFELRLQQGGPCW